MTHEHAEPCPVCGVLLDDYACSACAWDGRSDTPYCAPPCGDPTCTCSPEN